MPWDIIIRISHVIGTVLGVGGATMSQIFIFKALSDGKVSKTEDQWLKITYTVLRIGLVVLVISGFAFLLHSRLEGFEERLYSARTWSKIIMTLIILINAVLLQVRRIPFWLGSSVSLVSWYGALVLGVWRGLTAGYLGIFSVYIIAIFVVAFILEKIRQRMKISKL